MSTETKLPVEIQLMILRLLVPHDGYLFLDHSSMKRNIKYAKGKDPKRCRYSEWQKLRLPCGTNIRYCRNIWKTFTSLKYVNTTWKSEANRIFWTINTLWVTLSPDKNGGYESEYADTFLAHFTNTIPPDHLALIRNVVWETGSPFCTGTRQICTCDARHESYILQKALRHLVSRGLSEFVAFELVLECLTDDKCSVLGQGLRGTVLSLLKTEDLRVTVYRFEDGRREHFHRLIAENNERVKVGGRTSEFWHGSQIKHCDRDHLDFYQLCGPT